jgi:uncharacterized protein
MQLEHNFTVAAPVDRAWEVLLDLERIVPCMPGAALTSHEGDEFTGTVRVKLGPMVMSFAGRGRFVERDVVAHRMVIEAAGRDTKGAGSAAAKINATLRADGEVTAVAVLTDLTITGRVAQLGRGMIADVSSRLLDEFTACLAGQLAPPATAAAPVASTAAAAPPAVSTARPSAGVAAGATSQPAATAEPQNARDAVAAPRAAAEPIDLLRVTGVGATARRITPYLLTFLVGAAVGALIARWLG